MKRFNVIEVVKEFTYLKFHFQPEDRIYINDLQSLRIIRLKEDQEFYIPLNAHSEVLKNDVYNVTRFLMQNHKSLELILIENNKYG